MKRNDMDCGSVTFVGTVRHSSVSFVGTLKYSFLSFVGTIPLIYKGIHEYIFEPIHYQKLQMKVWVI